MFLSNDIGLTNIPSELLELGAEFNVRCVICLEGSMEIIHGHQHVFLSEYEIMFLPPNTKDTQIITSEDCKSSGLACKTALTNFLAIPSSTAFHAHSNLQLHQIERWQLDRNIAISLHQLFYYLQQLQKSPFFHEMFLSLFQFILYAILSKIPIIDNYNNKKSLNRSEIVFLLFTHLLNTYYKKEREVAFYAGKLNISPKHLSSVCKAQSGQNASALINKVVAEKIADLLQNSELSIKNICEQFNFPSVSFFGRYVKKHVGYPPQTFRKRAQGIK